MIGEVNLGELLCDSLVEAENASLLQFAISANEVSSRSKLSRVKLNDSWRPLASLLQVGDESGVHIDKTIPWRKDRARFPLSHAAAFSSGCPYVCYKHFTGLAMNGHRSALVYRRNVGWGFEADIILSFGRCHQSWLVKNAH